MASPQVEPTSSSPSPAASADAPVVSYAQPGAIRGTRDRGLMQPQFLVAAIVMFVAALGLNGATGVLKLHYKKEAVELRKPLDTIPLELGPWFQVSADEALEHSAEDVLGTKKYIFRDYVDTRRVSADVIKEFDGKSSGDRQRLLMAVQQKDRAAVMKLCVTYYTGMVDTVAHIPDRCYVLSGWEPSQYEVLNWAALADRPGKKEVRYIFFEDQTPGNRMRTQNVAYFFHCNGEYESDPLSGVRYKLQSLREKYGYYAKIELMNLMEDHKAAGVVMNEFLVDALPQIERCLPDWDAVKRGEKK